jgi:hypothetical protein
MQGIFPGQLHGREVASAVMNRFGPFGVPYQGVIAPPTPMLQLMKLHFDLDAFVTALNHKCPPSSNNRAAGRNGPTIIKA